MQCVKVDQVRLKEMIRSTLNQYLTEDHMPAKALHEEAQQRYGDHYRPRVTTCFCIANVRN